MPLYTPSELKKMRSGHSQYRKIELEFNVPKRLYIASNRVCYKRIHPNVKIFSTYKNAKYPCVDCFDQTPGDSGKGCPICDEINRYWAEWRELDKKAPKVKTEAKTKIQTCVNRLKGEYYSLNAIDLDDPEEKFFVVVFTKPTYKNCFEPVDEKQGTQNVIWLFQKTREGENTKYSLVAMPGQDLIVKDIKGRYEELFNRSYDHGGPIDMEKAILRTYSKQEYLEILNSDEVEDDKMPEEHAKETQTQKVENSKVKIEEESIPLDDLESPPKKEEKKEQAKSMPDSIDDLELEPIEYTPDKKEIKILQISAKEINEKRMDKNFIMRIYTFLLKEKKIETKENYKDQLLACYNLAKTKDIDIPETEFTVPF